MIRCIDDDTSSYSDIKVNFQVKNPSHYNAYDGGILVDILVGTEPFDIRWYQSINDTISTEKDLYNIKSGWYLFSIIDKKGRHYSDSFFLATNDTIYPKEYFPVYPGSYWEYNDGSRIECENDYKKVKIYDCLPKPHHSYETEFKFRPHDSIFVPVWDGKPIFEYSEINYNNDYIPLIPILFETKNEKVQFNQDPRYFSCCIMTLTTDTSIYIDDTQYNNVIVTISGCGAGMSLEGFPHNFNDSELEKRYYAKNIGLIKVERKLYPDYVYETIKEIVSWNINYNK